MSITLVRTRPCQFLFSMSFSRRDCDRSNSRLSRDMTSKHKARRKRKTKEKYIKRLENPRLCPKSDKYTFDRSLCVVSIWTFLGYVLYSSLISVQVIWNHFITIIYLIRDIFSSFYAHRHLVYRQVARLRTNRDHFINVDLLFYLIRNIPSSAAEYLSSIPWKEW